MVLALSALCIAIHYEVMLGIIGWYSLSLIDA